MKGKKMTGKSKETGQLEDKLRVEVEQHYGAVAYTAYYSHSKGKSLVSGDQLPSWAQLSEVIKEAWVAAAEAVLRSHANQEL